MADYRLEALSARTFEHLVQSLALRAISDQLIPFGDGPDGGREATFDGPTHYGPEGAKWNGYGVIQAKFKQRLGDGDGRWAEQELVKELAAYRSRKKPRRVPEYYIFATNVVLTPAQETGSKDRVLEILATFAAENDIKAFDVWDYDKFRALLDNNEDVRDKYSAWITPGDVLAELARQLKSRRHDYYKIMVNLLQKEIIADQYAKLEQAGHSADEAIPLSQVFVDLPVAVEPVTDPDEALASRAQNFAAMIIDAAKERFVGHDKQSQGTFGEPGEQAGRYVLIGGPGQGKTTLGQLVCQVFRAALLSDANRSIIDIQAQHAMDEVLSQWAANRIPRPEARRMPFRVVLSEFAKRLADNEVVGLLDYLAKFVSKRASFSFSIADLKELMLRYPSVLVLDGLDEVPPSTNRDAVLASVRDFRVDVATDEIDVLLVATSRPQGYNDDFSPRLYRHLYLVPLRPEIALDYASRLTQIRFGQDPARYDKVVARLRRAAATPATARLMRSPLQVTIMTLLVDRMGQPPQERWALFNEYYNLIYQREIERDIPAAAILRDYRNDIDTIHTRVGLVLQTESERSGGTDSKLATEQFSSIVESYLRDEGHEGSDLDALNQSIIEAAANRLVFLVGLESGQVGFEIRSLQEFMAAEGLMDGDDVTVQNRLRHIARIEHWRNVFLFAAGKCFSDRRHLRDTIGQICAELNDNAADEISMVTLAGSRLALDLLEDGPAARQPIMSRTLTRLALRLLDVVEPELLNRLFATYQERTSQLFIDELSARLGHPSEEIARVAAASVARLADLTDLDLHGLTAHIEDNVCLSNIEDVALLVRLGDGRPGLVRNLAVQAIPLLGPAELARFSWGYGMTIWDPLSESPQWLQAVSALFGPTRPQQRLVSIPVFDGSRKIGEIALPSVEQVTGILSHLRDLPSDRKEWELRKSMVAFAESPSRARLVAVVKAAAGLPEREVEQATYLLATWPLAVALDAALGRGSWDQVISEAAGGAWGDLNVWQAREEQLSRGLSLDELMANLYMLAVASLSLEADDESLRTYIDFVERNLSPNAGRRLLFPLYTATVRLYESKARSALLDRVIRLLLQDEQYGPYALMLLHRIGVSDPESPEWDLALELVPVFNFGLPRNSVSQVLLNLVERAWERTKSLRLLSGFAQCAQSPGIDANRLPQVHSLPREDLDITTLFATVVIGLRKQGDVKVFLDDIVRLARATPFYADCLFAALKASESLQRPYEEQVLVLHRALLECDEGASLYTSYELLRIARSYRSNLFDEEIWSRLRFPRNLRLVAMEYIGRRDGMGN